MTIQEFKAALVDGLDVPVYHILAAPEEECPVLCWQQLPTVDAYGDDAPVVNIVCAQLDYFTTTEYDETPTAVEALLLELGVAYERNEFTFDPDREEWRTIWTVQFLGG